MGSGLNKIKLVVVMTLHSVSGGSSQSVKSGWVVQKSFLTHSFVSKAVSPLPHVRGL